MKKSSYNLYIPTLIPGGAASVYLLDLILAFFDSDISSMP